ncbi:hypothetical protein P154DRAFT_562839 [Amniculicola lignicola CBS 123094]|uniref:Uncharacterized protein n=1 Tax=Amniculicola lignicola CBS 123094 TaxID=1392246 RepID=A0A6A5WUF9_9PLEO|nr:hypothetical protein P154DRAFT_562839 [Amniculicola lignicola CBS 123094]
MAPQVKRQTLCAVTDDGEYAKVTPTSTLQDEEYENLAIEDFTSDVPPFSPIKMLDNGLVDISHIPVHVQKLPRLHLLSLPGEVRNLIWEYTFGSLDIMIRREDYTNRSIPTGPAYYQRGYPFNPSDLSNFSIPRVCRQIYAETATMPYSHSVISFSFKKPDGAEAVDHIEAFSKRFTQAARNAIQSVRPDAVISIAIAKGRGRVVQRLTTIFPNLKNLYVWKPAVDVMFDHLIQKAYVALSLEPGGSILVSEENAEEILGRRLRRFEGRDVEVFFQDGAVWNRWEFGSERVL